MNRLFFTISPWFNSPPTIFIWYHCLPYRLTTTEREFTAASSPVSTITVPSDALLPPTGSEVFLHEKKKCCGNERKKNRLYNRDLFIISLRFRFSFLPFLLQKDLPVLSLRLFFQSAFNHYIIGVVYPGFYFRFFHSRHLFFCKQNLCHLR